LENERFEEIRQQIAENDVILYMKGTRVFPQDGYSAAMAQVLNDMGVSYQTVDVLEDRDLYQAIKEFTNWPNVPQLYVRGEFIGGSDIVKELQASGELKKLFDQHGLID
jgi:monothiol glutaredoxin